MKKSNGIIKSMLAVLTCAVLCSSLQMSVFAKKKDDTPKFDENNIAVRFMATSDTHLALGDDDHAKKFVNAVKKCQELAGGAENLNAISISGDIFHEHPLLEAKEVKKLFDANINPDNTELLLAIGNHDAYYDNAFSGKNTFEDAFPEYVYNHPVEGNSPIDVICGNYDTLINGFHFITLRGIDADTPQDSLMWLNERLSIITAKDKTKPVFIFQHTPPANTCNGSYEVGRFQSRTIGEILEQYPQAVIITGHSHANGKREDTVWQGAYTAINAGTCQSNVHYIEVDNKGFMRMRTYSTSPSLSAMDMAYSRELHIPMDLKVLAPKGPSVPVIIAIVVGGVLAVSLIIFIILHIYKTKKRKQFATGESL